MSQYNFISIGVIHSCYKEKFGIPRQPGLVASPATIEIAAAYSKDEAFRELDTFSHIWVNFVFHGVEHKVWKPTVRPPRLGGNQRVGVFASRSMFRPNPIGLSVVKLKSIERKNENIILNIEGGDFLDGTPVLDIKPYIPYADAIATEMSGYASEQPKIQFSVIFSPHVSAQLEKIELQHPNISNVIIQVLQLDPRPAYQNKNTSKKEFVMKLYDYDLKWHIDGDQIIVTEIFVI